MKRMTKEDILVERVRSIHSCHPGSLELNLQAQNGEGYHEQVDDEEVGDAKGETEDHRQYSEPVSERSRVS